MNDHLHIGLDSPPWSDLGNVGHFDVLLKIGNRQIGAIEMILVFRETLQSGTDMPVRRGYAEQIGRPARNHVIEGDATIKVIIKHTSVSLGIAASEKEIDFPGLLRITFVLPNRLVGDAVESIITVQRAGVAVASR